MKSKRVLRVYVCSPLRGDIEANQALARQLCKAVIDEGHAPFAPHIFYTQFLDDTVDKERAAGMLAGTAWLLQADEIWVFAESIDDCSNGMLEEVTRAKRCSIPPVAVWMPHCWVPVQAEHAVRLQASRLALRQAAKAEAAREADLDQAAP